MLANVCLPYSRFGTEDFYSGWAVFALAHQFLFNIICWLWNAMEIHPVKLYFMTFL